MWGSVGGLECGNMVQPYMLSLLRNHSKIQRTLKLTMTDGKLPATLSKVAITSLPESAYYIPDFINPAEEALILNKVLALLLLLLLAHLS